MFTAMIVVGLSAAPAQLVQTDRRGPLLNLSIGRTHDRHVVDSRAFGGLPRGYCPGGYCGPSFGGYGSSFSSPATVVRPRIIVRPRVEIHPAEVLGGGFSGGWDFPRQRSTRLQYDNDGFGGSRLSFERGGGFGGYQRVVPLGYGCGPGGCFRPGGG